MKTLSFFAAIMFSIFSINTSSAQTLKTETIKVWGNCGMCKTKIEKAAKAAGAKIANWNEDSKELKVTYAVNKTSSVKIQQAIAKSGYDTQDFTAVNTAYNNLPGCCKYDRKSDNATKAKCCDNEKCGAGADCCKDMTCCKDKDCCSKKDGMAMKCCTTEKCDKDAAACKDMNCCKDKTCCSKAVAVVAAGKETMREANTINVDNAESKVQLPALLSQYLDIKNALVSSNATIAAAKAGELVKAIDAINMQKLSVTDHNAFMAVQDKLKTSAQAISETTKIEEQRNAFSTLSNTIYTLAKSAKLSDATVYQQYCSMKKMYWLSNETTIKNPYYGKAMLTCGKVTDTLSNN